MQDLNCNRPDLYSTKGFNLQASEMHVSGWKWELLLLLLPFQDKIFFINVYLPFIFFFKQATFTLLTEAKIRSSHWKLSYPVLTVGDGDSHEKCWCYLKSWLCNHIFALPRKDSIYLSEEYRGRRKVWCHCLSTTYQCESLQARQNKTFKIEFAVYFFNCRQFLIVNINYAYLPLIQP